MADPKQVYRATDSAPAALYAKRQAASDDVYPVLTNSAGMLLSGAGLGIPFYDALSFSYTSTGTTITFKSGGLSGSTVATVAIVFTDATKETISTIAKS